MVKVDLIKKIIKHALASGKLKGERPLSIIIIAHVEGGKTTLIRRYCFKEPYVFYVSDATAHGILQDTDGLEAFGPDGYTHIAIPDLMTCIGRKQNTVSMLINFLNALVEEGVVNISTFMTHIDRNVEVRAGLITAIPPDPFKDKRHKWGRMGFLSRALPITYDYKASTQQEIMMSIQKGKHLSRGTVKLHLPEKPTFIKLPYKMAKRIEPYAESLANQYSKYQKVYGFRYQKQLQTLVKAIALFRGKREVDQECIDELEKLSSVIGFEFNKI